MMIGRTMLWIFLLPGNLISDVLGVHSEDDRILIRSLINMLVWNLVVVLAVVLW